MHSGSKPSHVTSPTFAASVACRCRPNQRSHGLSSLRDVRGMDHGLCGTKHKTHRQTGKHDGGESKNPRPNIRAVYLTHISVLWKLDSSKRYPQITQIFADSHCRF